MDIHQYKNISLRQAVSDNDLQEISLRAQTPTFDVMFLCFVKQEFYITLDQRSETLQGKKNECLTS